MTFINRLLIAISGERGRRLVCQNMKILKPSLREKKRYIAFEVISKTQLPMAKVQKAVILSMLSYKGEAGIAESGIQLVHERFNANAQRGILRVNRQYVNDAIAALTLVRTIDNNEVAIRSLSVSGMINKVAS